MTDEQRAERLRYHMYDTNEGIREHAERIVDLEELVADMVDYSEGAGNGMAEWFADRMRDLGIEVDE